MKALILLAEGFETVEALATYDILKRSHRIDPTLCSIGADLPVVSSQGIKIQAEAILARTDLTDFDMIILPGGKKGVENLKASQDVVSAIWTMLLMDKDVHAICAAPSILCEMGLLNHSRYTCFPGFQSGEGEYSGEGVTNDEGLITGKSMGYTIPFAEEIVRYYFGEEAVEEIRKGTLGR
ncbi:MAG: DJ-1/PfpI family protein [Bacilli bacterium]|nr:DJ-1/PfpI family protein [Bacilli bacterium]